ncbi:anti-sigma factor [Mariniblastus fucicola]|uniref:Anti-sigma-K factor rskA n=2 Tax=Mariniblastus fucicola TaxID=980251 RepID=A0A5B9PF77_9BACT|nr:anti-sigma factor [Mariniblastus fucicola]QEG25058.1 Anti-sigma-K factor rskA [Mariniblastus fucicola]
MIDSVMTSEEFPQWFVDLLVLRATDKLDADQQRQFDQFVDEHPDRDRIELEAEKYELTAAAIEMGLENVVNVDSESAMNSMPEALRKKVLEGAKRHFEAMPATSEVAAPKTPTVSRAPEAGLTSREALAWLAAAAAVVLLLTGWNPFAAPTAVVDNGSAIENRTPTVEEQLADFLSGEEADLVRVDWTPTDKDSDASGEVVWRDSAQQGFMVFDGLRPNDPAQSQYQLWIFDSQTGDKHPIDGGVFDVAAGQKTIVPIDARIPVADVSMFAITEEKPGGVVVSDRERLPLLAKVN